MAEPTSKLSQVQRWALRMLLRYLQIVRTRGNDFAIQVETVFSAG